MLRPFRILLLSAVLVQSSLTDATASVESNYHLIGWLNAAVPGSGAAILGDPELGAIQATTEVGTFVWGYSYSRRSPMTLDGVPAELPAYHRSKRYQLQNLNKPLYANLLQEFGIKFHFVNTFNAYRESARRAGVNEAIDQTSTLDLFLAPFDSRTLSDPWVWIPIGILTGMTVTDYYSSRGKVDRSQPLSSYSNFLFTFHYGMWEPAGSGAPEEMFYRGFLQNEFSSMIPSPYFAIPASSALFALSHAPGDGRLTAAIAGLYLGYLAHRNHGSLAPGIAVHFWGGVLLGLETILLSHEAQHATPPGGFGVQINF